MDSNEPAKEINHAYLYSLCRDYTKAVDDYNQDVGNIALLAAANKSAEQIKRLLSQSANPATNLTRMQEEKMRHLADRNGLYSGVTVHIDMPDGERADIDPFGRVSWKVL